MTELNLRRLAHLATLNTSDKGKKAAETRWSQTLVWAAANYNTQSAPASFYTVT